MILSYKDKDTESFANGERIKRFSSFQEQAERRLTILEAAPNAKCLQQLPSNRFEALSGDRAGQYSIRINLKWRICFEWPLDAPGPSNVEIVDYH